MDIFIPVPNETGQQFWAHIINSHLEEIEAHLKLMIPMMAQSGFTEEAEVLYDKSVELFETLNKIKKNLPLDQNPDSFV